MQLCICGVNIGIVMAHLYTFCPFSLVSTAVFFPLAFRLWANSDNAVRALTF